MSASGSSVVGAGAHLSHAQRVRLEHAADLASKALSRDAKVKERDLHERLLKQARAHDGALYELCESEAAPPHKRPRFVHAPSGFIGLPAALKRAVSQQLEGYTFSGLFPEIHRAWITIDKTLFIWDYTDPRGAFYQYDGLDQPIVHVALVPTRAGVFASEAAPRFLLLLSTPVEVVVLAVYVSSGAGGGAERIDLHETGFSGERTRHATTPLPPTPTATPTPTPTATPPTSRSVSWSLTQYLIVSSTKTARGQLCC